MSSAKLQPLAFSESERQIKDMRLTAEQKQIAIGLASQGKTLAEIRDAIGISQQEFWEYRQENSDFAEAFARARQEGLEELADGLLTITEEEHDVQKARLRSENVRWLLSKRKPHVYGDRIDLNVNQTIDINAALLEARQRAALPMSYQRPTLEGEAIEIKGQIEGATADSQSADAASEQDAAPSDEPDIFS